MPNPELSILTPTYNGGHFLPRALQSTAAVIGDGRVEHVVADGGSADDTVDQLASSHAVWVSQPDRGQSDALNTALAMSTGRWIGWLNCDEYYLEGVLPAILEILDSTDADVVFGDFVEVTPEDEIIRLVTQHAMRPSVLRHFGLSMPSCTVFVRRSLVEQAGGWNADNRTMMDWELWLELLSRGARFHYTRRAHAGFTRHDEQASTRLADLVASEHRRLNAQFDIASGSARRFAVRGVRVGLKATNGSYVRELRFADAIRRDPALRSAQVLRESSPGPGRLDRFVLR